VVPRLLDAPNSKCEARIYSYDAAGIKAHCISGRIKKYTNLNCSVAGRAKTSSNWEGAVYTSSSYGKRMNLKDADNF
jgi:hypothetical protein